MRGYFSVTCGFGLVCLLAFLAGTAVGAAEPKRESFRVTFEGRVAKDWDTVKETTENGCPTSRRSVGHRTVSFRSARPSTVMVTFENGRVSYSPAVVRFLTMEIKQSGSRTTRVEMPCRAGNVHVACRRMRRVVAGARVRFFRKARDELAFYPSRLPQIATTCPSESATVRAIRPGLQQALGGISEAALASRRAQTGLGSSEVTTDLDGAEKGQVVERVHWALTFTPIR
jgi:hypothetical protein